LQAGGIATYEIMTEIDTESWLLSAAHMLSTQC